MMQLSLRNKVLTAVGISGILFIVSLSAIVGYRVYLFVESHSLELANKTSKEVAKELEKYIEVPVSKIQTLSNALSKTRPDREGFNAIIRKMKVENEEYIATYGIFEPYLYDGRDNDFQYALSQDHDKKGRFIPSFP